MLPTKQLINNIPMARPQDRLKALNSYMVYWIDHYPYCPLSFQEFIIKKYRRIIPGTIEYFRSLATHCFYCNNPFDNSKARLKTIDHWVPKSKGQTSKYVIACEDCNTHKSDNSPVWLISQFLKACLQNKTMWGYHGKKLNYIAGQLEIITNDVLYNKGPLVYYFKR